MRYAQDLIVAVVSACLVLAVIGFWGRVRFTRDHSSFTCRTARLSSRWWHREGMRWRWFRARAAWVDSVLVVRKGPVSLRTLTIPVFLPPKARIEEEVPSTVRWLGPCPQSLWIELADGSPFKIAVRSRDRTKLAGPFLAAAIAGLPAARRENRRPTP
jgi:hypothetical protein